MTEKARCEICDRNFKDADGLAMHNSSKHSKINSKQKKEFKAPKISKGTSIFLATTISLIVLIWWGISTRTILPPTDIAGHIEVSPDSHVLKEPMDIRVQKHMLEHVDGIDGGRPGAIINYNCEDYACELGVIKNLEAFAKKYNHVYIAPFKGMDAKIALTKLNRIEILEEYNEERIDKFIR